MIKYSIEFDPCSSLLYDGDETSISIHGVSYIVGKEYITDDESLHVNIEDIIAVEGMIVHVVDDEIENGIYVDNMQKVSVISHKHPGSVYVVYNGKKEKISSIFGKFIKNRPRLFPRQDAEKILKTVPDTVIKEQ